MSTTIKFNHYEFQGQVYSPAFSEPNSPISTDSNASSNPGSPNFERKSQEFKSKVPKYANKYEEMLQPMSPVTFLKTSEKIFESDCDENFQRKFFDLVQLADSEEIDEFLSENLDKVDINKFNQDGHTALQISCLEGHLELAKILVKFGAKLHLCTRDGFSILHLAVFSGHSNLMSYILSLQ